MARNHKSKRQHQRKQKKAERRSKRQAKQITAKKKAVAKKAAPASIKKKQVAKIPPPKKTPNGPRFLYGPIQTPQSSWVAAIGYLHTGEKGANAVGVAVQFKDGFECYYPGTGVSDYQYLRKAASKGKSIWRRFYELPYDGI